MTKKNVFISSLLGLTVVVGLMLLDSPLTSRCEYVDETGHAVKYCEYLAYSLIPLAAALPISLLSFYIKEETFYAWVRFAKWWIPLSVLVTLVSPVETGGWISLPIKGLIALTSSVLLVVVSLILIAYKSYKLRGK